MTVQDVLNGLAAAAQALANSTSDPVVKASASGAAVFIALIGRVLEGRTPEEAKAVLEGLLKTGVKPITNDDLDAQAKQIVDQITGQLP
jgi:hypothetical protein